MGRKVNNEIFAVIDTNVLVSAMLKKLSPPDQIMQEIFKGTITPLLNKEILDEYWNVLRRPKFKFSEKAVNVLITSLMKQAIFVDAESVEEILPDPKDVVFYEVVMEGRKTEDAYLVTGNKKHFPLKPFIVDPRQMVEIIEEAKRVEKDFE